MAIRRRVKRVGGSLGVLIPRDIAEAMSVREGSEVYLSLVGRQVEIEPADETMGDATFRKAFATVLRRYGQAFEQLAARDRGENPTVKKPRGTARARKR